MTNNIFTNYFLFSILVYTFRLFFIKIVKCSKFINNFYKKRRILYGVKNWDNVRTEVVSSEVLSILEVLSITFFYMLIYNLIQIDGLMKVFIIYIAYIFVVFVPKIKLPLVYASYPKSLLLMDSIISSLIILLEFFVLYFLEQYLRI